MNDFWLEYEKADKEESGGGGIVGLVNVRTGYKVYASGADQEESFFDAPASNKAARAKARAAATKYASDHGANQARWSVLLHVPVDSAIRVIDGEWQPVTWMADRYFVVNTWTDAAKEVVVPSLKAAGVTEIPCTIYARIGFKPDPYKESLGEAGMTDKDQDGNPRFPQVAYIVEVFDSLDAARAACGLETGGNTGAQPASNEGDPPLPDDWAGYPDAWMDEVRAIKEEYPGPLPKVKAALEADADNLASKHSCTPEDVLAWYSVV